MQTQRCAQTQEHTYKHTDASRQIYTTAHRYIDTQDTQKDRHTQTDTHRAHIHVHIDKCTQRLTDANTERVTHKDIQADTKT